MTRYSYNKEIYRLVENGWKVLDVGCANGCLGERLKADKQCFVVGVEIDKDRANQAKNRLDAVFNFDVELLEDLVDYAPFDAVILADSLEHLRYPVTTLIQLSKYLNADGYFLISLPNVANWIIRLRLLFGKFDYQESGILDKSHLHFFTLASAKKLVQEAGFEIVCIRNYNEIMKLGSLWKGLFAHDFIIKARKLHKLRN